MCCFFDGRQVVKPEELTKSASVYRQTSVSVMQETDAGQELKEEEYLGRTRDIKMGNRSGRGWNDCVLCRLSVQAVLRE